MKALTALMRAYAYLYHLVLAAFLAGLALVAYATGIHNLNFGGMTSMSGLTLSRALLATGLAGIALIVLAFLGKLRWLFAFYCVGIVITMFRWFFTSSYNFGSRESFWVAVWVFAGAVLAMLFSFIGMGRHDRRPVKSKRR